MASLVDNFVERFPDIAGDLPKDKNGQTHMIVGDLPIAIGCTNDNQSVAEFYDPAMVRERMLETGLNHIYESDYVPRAKLTDNQLILLDATNLLLKELGLRKDN